MNIVHFIVSVLAILVAAYIVPSAEVTVLGAVILAIVLGVLNLFVKPLITILTLPITILTLGLFSLVINALLVLLADAIIPDFSVGGFWIAVLFSIVLSLINAFFHLIIRSAD
jgi:putative membrane protein